MAINRNKIPKNILVIRFSAIGDVAITVPVIQSLAEKYPECRVTMLSNVKFKPFFSCMPDNFHFLGIDLKEYHGSGGLKRLKQELMEMDFDAVADLHGVIRSRIISMMFKWRGVKVRSINKGRLSRYGLTRFHLKDRHQRLTSFERYSIVLKKLGFTFDLNFSSIFGIGKGDINLISDVTGIKGGSRWIGVAPFAAHRGKIYPTQLMEQVISMINETTNVEKIFVFAYGKEQEQIENWNKFGKVILIGGKLNMSRELILMSHLDVMLAMDSSNMHLASLTATPVVSIWGATHISAGFLGFGQKQEDCVQLDLPCRPCSIYGKKPCRYGDYHCMTSIHPQMVMSKLKRYL